MTFYKKLGTVLFCSIVLTNICFAQEKITLSVEDSVKYALERNVSIKQSDISLNQAKRSRDTSWNALSPSVGVTSKFSGTDFDSKVSQTYVGSVSLNVSSALLSNIKAAQLNYELSELDYESTVKTIELNVRKYYYSILYELENIKLQTQSLETSKAQYEANVAKYNMGLISSLDVLNAQVSYENNKLSVESLKTTYQNDLASFKQMLGIPQETEIEFNGSIESALPKGKVSIEGIKVDSADINSMNKKLEIAKNAVTQTRLGYYGPTFTTSYSYSAGGNLGEELKTSGLYGQSFSFGASIALDSFLPWSSAANSIKKQEDSVKTIKLQLENLKVTVDVNISNYLKKIETQQQNVTLRQNNIEIAEKSYKLTKEAYDHGTKDLLSLQTSYNNYLSSKVSLMSEQYTLICTIMDLENTIGVPFGTLSLGE